MLRRVTTAQTPRRRDYPGWRMVWVLSGTCTVAYGCSVAAAALLLAAERHR